ncbi:MAG: ABC transporter permease [Terriglobales bacterium]
MTLGGFLQDLRGGFRLLLKRPGFTVVAVLSLALGIGANTTVFTLINAVFLRSVPVAEPGRVVAIYTQDARNAAAGYLPSSYINLRDYKEKNTVFSDMSVMIGSGVTWDDKGHPQPLPAALVSADYFSLLGERINPGRNFLPDEDGAPGAHAVAVMSHDLWERQFGGDPGLIGKSINLNGLDYTVIGIAPAEFRNVGGLVGPDLWIPAAMHDQVLTGVIKAWFLERRPAFSGAVARLKPGVGLRQAQLAMHAMAMQLAQQYPTDDGGRDLALVPLSQSSVPPNARAAFLLAGTLLFAIAGLVLLIACANVANLLLVRAAQRRREFAVRLALGAGRGRLIAQLLTESLLLGLLGGVAAIGLAILARDGLWALRPPGLPAFLHPALSAPVLAFTMVIALAATALFGLAPALQATRTAPLASLRDRTETPGGGVRWYGLRGLLVVAQVAFSLVALVGASLFVHSLINAQKVSPGFDARHLIVLNPNLQAARYSQARADQFYKDAVARLQTLPQVAAASVTDSPPFAGGLARTTFRAGVDTNDTRLGKLTPVPAVRPGYFKTMGIPILRGRDIAESDTATAPLVAVVNQALADRLWPGQDALGKHMRFLQEPWDVTVVGEVPTVKFATLGEPPQAQVYFALEQQWAPASILVRTVGDPMAALPSLRAVIQGLDPNLPPLRSRAVQQTLDQLLTGPATGAELLAVFGLLALLLAAVGTYGVMSYSVTQRGREIGIRMALGAAPGDVMRLILGSGLAMVAAGTVAGLGLAAALGRGLGSLLFGITGSDGASFTIAPAVLLCAAFIACWLPARRALRVDPNAALRDE